MGADSVPQLLYSYRYTKGNIEGSILNYLCRFVKRRYGVQIMEKKVKDFIKTALKMDLDSKTTVFLRQIYQSYKNLQRLIRFEYKMRRHGFLSEVELINKLEEGVNVVILCDKNMGMSILDLEIMRKADSELMRQMGALSNMRLY